MCKLPSICKNTIVLPCAIENSGNTATCNSDKTKSKGNSRAPLYREDRCTSPHLGSSAMRLLANSV